MKNLTFEEIYKLFKEEQKKDLEEATKIIQARDDTPLSTLLDYRHCLEVVTNTTSSLKDDGSNLIAIHEEIETLKENVINDPTLFKTPAVKCINDVDGFWDGEDYEVKYVDTFYEVTSYRVKKYSDMINLEYYFARERFKKFILKYTKPEGDTSYNYILLDCKVLKNYQEGNIDLKTLQLLTYGDCTI